jgi:hypothetical protein
VSLEAHVEGGYDPFTKEPNAAYHYEGDRLWMIRSETGIELHEPSGKFFLGINHDDIVDNAHIHSCIMDAITIHLQSKGMEYEDIQELVKNASLSICMKGDGKHVAWHKEK